jgi:hypothetical protein
MHVHDYGRLVFPAEDCPVCREAGMTDATRHIRALEWEIYGRYFTQLDGSVDLSEAVNAA